MEIDDAGIKKGVSFQQERKIEWREYALATSYQRKSKEGQRNEVQNALEACVKELLGMDLGYRESNESWAETLRDLRNRGLEAPMAATGDGALGLWAALDEVYPTT